MCLPKLTYLEQLLEYSETGARHLGAFGNTVLCSSWELSQTIVVAVLVVVA